MYLDDKTDAVIAALKSADALSDCKIIKAFPFVRKPTFIGKSVIAVSPYSVDVENIAVGQECCFGNYSIEAEIFSPQELGTPGIAGTVEKMLGALMNLEPKGIKAYPIDIDANLRCYTAKCVLTFNGEISFGGENDGI